jgi:hypothetical protein
MNASFRPSAPCALALVSLCLLLGGCGHPSAASTSQELLPAKGALDTVEAGASEGSRPSETSDAASPATDSLATDSLATGSPAEAAPQKASPREAASSPESSAGAAPTRGKAPPADRQPQRPGEAEKITFDDLNIGMQADVVFRPFMLTDRVKELEDQRVSIVGYMHGGALSARGIHEFVLLKNTECKFGPGGQADHLAQVLLAAGAGTEFTKRPVKVEGRLKLEPFQGPDGNTWSIYRLEDAQIR